MWGGAFMTSLIIRVVSVITLLSYNKILVGFTCATVHKFPIFFSPLFILLLCILHLLLHIFLLTSPHISSIIRFNSVSECIIRFNLVSKCSIPILVSWVVGLARWSHSAVPWIRHPDLYVKVCCFNILHCCMCSSL